MSKEEKYSKNFIAGGIAGVFAKTIVAPIDRIKIFYLVCSKKFKYQYVLQDVQNIYYKEGIKQFWRGNLPNVIRAFPNSSIQFGVFDFLKSQLNKYDTNNKKKGIFLCGSIAGMTASTICYPLEFIRVRMAMEQQKFIYKGNFHAVKMIYKQEKFQTFFSGLGGIIPYHGTGFFLFDTLKESLIKNHPNKISWKFDFLFGYVSSMVALIISYPIDVIRKKFQGQGYFIEQGIQKQKYNYKKMIQNTIKQEGLRGFYKGITINLIKSPISTGTAWAAKNFLNQQLDQIY